MKSIGDIFSDLKGIRWNAFFFLPSSISNTPFKILFIYFFFSSVDFLALNFYIKPYLLKIQSIDRSVLFLTFPFFFVTYIYIVNILIYIE